MPENRRDAKAQWRVIVVGGHTRSIGKTQLVCDIIAAFPEVHWIAGKITQYGHGVCAQNGADCDCAPREHVCAMEWESEKGSGTDSARFLSAGAKRSFWLRTKQGFLAEGLPLLRGALQEGLLHTEDRRGAAIIESNSLMQFFKPDIYVAVVDPSREDFKPSARAALDRADAVVLRHCLEFTHGGEAAWKQLPAKLLSEKPSFLQKEGEPLPEFVKGLVQRVLERPSGVPF